MDWAAIGSFITSFGFPTLACCVMAWYVKHVTDAQRIETKELNEQHTKEMLAFKDEIKDALNNNTIALTRLCDKLDTHGGLTSDKG